jgi:hypothetical protein
MKPHLELNSIVLVSLVMGTTLLHGCVTFRPPSLSSVIDQAQARGRAEKLAAGQSAESAAMSPECQRILAQLAPYAQQIEPSLTALMVPLREIGARNDARMPAEMGMAMAQLGVNSALSAAGAVNPAAAAANQTAGIAFERAQAAREQAYAAEDAPLAAEANAKAQQVGTQGQNLQANQELQRLLAEGQAKGCFQSPSVPPK